MTRVLAILFLAFALGACQAAQAVNTAANTPVTQGEINSAKNAAYAIESGYDTVLSVAIAWGSQPVCGTGGARQPPLCSTRAGILAIEKARVSVRSALDRLNGLIKDTGTTSSLLSVAVAAAQQAYGAWQDILAAYNVKQGK